MKPRLAHACTDAMACGVAAVALLDALDWSGVLRVANLSWRDLAQLHLINWLVWVAFFGAKRAAAPVAAGLAIVALLGAWRRTRAAAVLLVCVVGGAAVAVGTAWLCVTAYALTPGLALAAPLGALLPAVWLARRAWPIAATCLATFGALAGVVGAQLAWMLAVRAGDPSLGFLLPTALGLGLAGARARWGGADRPMSGGRRVLRLWGACALSLCAVSIVVFEHAAWQPRPAAAPAQRVVEGGAYDVYVAGTPPQAVWTDRQKIQVLDDPYGAAQRHYALDESATMVERIWPASDGGFYVQANRSVGFWPAPGDGQAIPYRPAAWIALPAWIVDSASTVGTLVEDARTRRLLLVGEWLSHFSALDLADGAALADGVIGHAVWSWWYGTVPPRARAAFMTSPFDEGLYTFDFDTLRATRQAGDLYLYETVFDPDAQSLWGVRPMTGEVLEVDAHSFAVRTRLRIEPTLRDIKRDPLSGDLFTCSFLTGDLFRIDAHSHTVRPFGWCGRMCRNLYFDAPRRTLWVASADGLCRIPAAPAAADDRAARDGLSGG
jgi:hypothetical protein